MQSRDRSDSVETDKGNPNQDKVLSNLESHLMNEGGQELNGSENIIVLPNNSSFESPKRNTSAIMPFEESKAENQDLITPLVDTTFMPMPYDYEDVVNPFNEQPTSKKRIARGTTGRSASASRQREQVENPRRSKRLESRHRALQMMQDGVERQPSYIDPEDELNRAQSS